VIMIIDYIDIATFGIRLLKSEGEFNAPKVKRPLMHNWPDEHGLDIDLSTNQLETRKIVFKMIMESSSVSEFDENINLFSEILNASGLRVISLPHLFFPMFLALDAEMDVVLLNSLNTGNIVHEINLEFIEPFPRGRFFIQDNSVLTVSFTISSSSTLRVHWGDSTSEVVFGNTQAISHTYISESIPHYIGIFGNITDISTLTDLVGLVELVYDIESSGEVV